MLFTLLYFYYYFSGDRLQKDESIRDKIKSLKDKFDDLVYEFTDDADINESSTEEDSTSSEHLILSEAELNRDLYEALSIGLERLSLMDQLDLKCRSRLDFVSELWDVACDCNASRLKPLIRQRGIDLATTFLGPKHHETRQWIGKAKDLSSTDIEQV